MGCLRSRNITPTTAKRHHSGGTLGPLSLLEWYADRRPPDCLISEIRLAQDLVACENFKYIKVFLIIKGIGVRVLLFFVFSMKFFSRCETVVFFCVCAEYHSVITVLVLYVYRRHRAQSPPWRKRTKVFWVSVLLH